MTEELDGIVIGGTEYDVGGSGAKDDNSQANLNIGDENGNVLAEFKDGHIKTKNFDSRNGVASKIDTASKLIYAEADTLTNGTISIDVPNVRNHYVLSFNAVIKSFESIKIHFGSGSYVEGRLLIDSTNITEYSYPGLSPSSTAHGMNIANYIVVTIKPIRLHYAQLIIASGADVFTKEIAWAGSGNGCECTVVGEFEHCKFSFEGDCFLRDIWCFGDSWTDIWPKFMDDLGYDNLMIDGFSGRGSATAYNSFLKDIKVAKPKGVVWMMGMNDPDSSTSVNSTWQDRFKKVYAKCQKLEIEFIACTICNTPDRNHYFKNEIIKGFGCRYIDLAKELGATEKNGIGYTGLMTSDGVHTINAGSLMTALTVIRNISFIQKK